MNRAVILGGTGVLGRAIALHLAADGWAVDVTGRDAANMPRELLNSGVTFVTSDRRDRVALARVIGAGADLVVDAACYTAADAQLVLPLIPAVGTYVMLSSKAVYVDAAGNHVNSPTPPSFVGPIREDNPTMRPSDADADSPEGYGANKVAAEELLLDSGRLVTVLRPSKVHGMGAARPREWMFVKRVLDRRPAVFLANGGDGGDHTTAAVNTAALVAHLATIAPGTRVLNSADPDAPTGLEIARAVAGRMGHKWEEILLDNSHNSALGDHPWNFRPPVVLDTGAATALGYRPVGNYAQTVQLEIDELVSSAASRPSPEDRFFAPFLDYAPEDAYLAQRG